jgi:hypothetical protein
MISPNRENIDRWLFDYTEGNLSAEQAAMLENFILNNPDLEVDLDAWNGSKLVSEEISLSNKEKFKRKRRVAPIYFSSLLILFTVGTLWIIHSVQKEKVSIRTVFDNASIKFRDKKQTISNNKQSNGQYEKISESVSQAENEKQIRNHNYFPNNFAHSSYKANLGNSNLDLNSNLLHGSAQSEESYEFSSNSNYIELNDSSINVSNTLASEASFSAESDFYCSSLKRIDSKSLKLDYYQIRNEELKLNGSENLNKRINLELGDIKIFRKIGEVLEKDLGLSNIPDHTYSIPEYSNVDVLFSNIGATSQIRFQSTSMARWIENIDQRKFAQQITLDGYSRSAQSAFGLQANYDYYANGSIQNWNTCLLFSPKIALTRSVSIEPALRLKIGNKLLNEDRITNHSEVIYESQVVHQFNYDSTIAIGSKLWYRDLDFGLTINTPYFYIGGQVSNILRHQNNIYSNYKNMDMRANSVFNAIIGTQYISRNQKIQFSPYCFYERISANRIFGGFSLKLNKFMLGASYGTGNVASGTLGLSFRNFALYVQSSYGYAPAVNKNSFIHQLTIRFNSNVDMKSRRYINF